MKPHGFPSDFLFGCATASYQVEGAGNEGGRKPCIWDTFAKVPGKVIAGADGSVSVDQYHRYNEDIKLMQDVGFQAYRFSFAWPRILPDGTGTPNASGIEYYRRLLSSLKTAGISPVATLYHWDLPQSLEDAGGWTERNTAFAFERYAQVCFESFGDLVDQWITLNEPYCSAHLGYYAGIHAPGRTSLQDCVQAIHYLNLAHGLAVKTYRKMGFEKPIGITLNLSTARPAKKSIEDMQAARNAVAFESEVFVLPIFEKRYPELLTKEFNLTFPVEEGDFEIIAQPIDCVGINYYYEMPVSWDDSAPFHYRTEPAWQETTGMGWPISPAGLLRILRWIDAKSGGLPLYITENGCACEDTVSDDTVAAYKDGAVRKRRVHDFARIDYLKKHLAVCLQAINEGLPLKGYFVWSLLDNYEWSYGYSKRFGVIYVDYSTLERIPKDSAYFLRDVIAGYVEYNI